MPEVAQAGFPLLVVALQNRVQMIDDKWPHETGAIFRKHQIIRQEVAGMNGIAAVRFVDVDDVAKLQGQRHLSPRGVSQSSEREIQKSIRSFWLEKVHRRPEAIRIFLAKAHADSGESIEQASRIRREEMDEIQVFLICSCDNRVEDGENAFVERPGRPIAAEVIQIRARADFHPAHQGFGSQQDLSEVNLSLDRR